MFSQNAFFLLTRRRDQKTLHNVFTILTKSLQNRFQNGVEKETETTSPKALENLPEMDRNGFKILP